MTRSREKIVWYYVVSQHPIGNGNQELTVLLVPDEKVQDALELREQIKTAVGHRETELQTSLERLVNLGQVSQATIKVPGNIVHAGQVIETTPPNGKLPWPLGVVTAYPSQPDSRA